MGKTPEADKAHRETRCEVYWEKNKAYQRAYRKAHPEKRKAYYAAHREEWKAYARARYDACPEAHRAKHYKRRYGITLADYDRMLKDQDGRCKICGRTPGHTRLCVDHDHATGEVRGLLCKPCNQALGLFAEDPSIVAKAAEYLTLAVTPLYMRSAECWSQLVERLPKWPGTVDWDALAS